MLEPANTIYRWDLDKTYLRTEFDTLRDLVRTAVEPASRKLAMPGAGALMRELRGTGPRAITILSGSPEQMRRVLEAKLRLDGIHWDSFTLKPSLQHLMRGRLRFLKDQVSYKLGALLEACVRSGPDTVECLFGDDAEADAFVYCLYADLCAGRVGTDQLLAVLERARVYRSEIPTLVRLAERLPRSDRVHRVFIHLERMESPEVFTDFGSRICPFYNYFQPAVVLLQDGGLPARGALRVGAEIILRHAFSPDALVASFLDLARRGHVGRRVAKTLVDAAASAKQSTFGAARPSLLQFGEALERRLDELGEAVPRSHEVVDYVDLFSRDKARARRARRRATWRRRAR